MQCMKGIRRLTVSPAPRSLQIPEVCLSVFQVATTKQYWADIDIFGGKGGSGPCECKAAAPVTELYASHPGPELAY